MHWRALLRWIVKAKISCDAEHIYCWRLPEIVNLLKSSGFEVKTIYFMDTHWAGGSIFGNVFPRITKESMFVKSVKTRPIDCSLGFEVIDRIIKGI